MRSVSSQTNLAPVFLLLLWGSACGSTSPTPTTSGEKLETAVVQEPVENTTTALDAGLNTDGQNSRAADSQLGPLLQDLPKNISTEQCDELCLIQAVCFERVNGGDYQGGNRCIDDCEGWGDEAAGDTEECLRSSAACSDALECF